MCFRPGLYDEPWRHQEILAKNAVLSPALSQTTRGQQIEREHLGTTLAFTQYMKGKTLGAPMAIAYKTGFNFSNQPDNEIWTSELNTRTGMKIPCG